MTAKEWNGKYRIGTPVDLVGHNGNKQMRSMTASKAWEDGDHVLVELEGLCNAVEVDMLEPVFGNVPTREFTTCKSCLGLYSRIDRLAQWMHPSFGSCNEEGPGKICSECHRIITQLKENAGY